LENGITASPDPVISAGSAGAGATSASPVRSLMLAMTFDHSWSPPPAQSQRSTHWMRSKGIGSGVLSTRTCTSLLSRRARSASDCTHSDRAASSDQITTTALAALRRSSITRAKLRWAGSSSSRQTPNPASRSASATRIACRSVERA
jgi:hypothetical protein